MINLWDIVSIIFPKLRIKWNFVDFIIVITVNTFTAVPKNNLNTKVSVANLVSNEYIAIHIYKSIIYLKTIIKI